MLAKCLRRIILFAALFVLERASWAQQPEVGKSQESAPQITPASSPAKQSTVPTLPKLHDALEDPVLDEAVEEHITYMDSHIALKYNQDELEGGPSLDRIRIHWLQAFGPSNRLAAGIEVPFLHFNGGETGPNANGIGDMTVEFRGMLSRGEKFEHAAGIELTVPSASSDPLGTGQTVLRLVWGFSAAISSHTLLSGEVGYDKAVYTQRSEPGDNFIEPELIVSQELGKRVGVFLDWDSYYDFNATTYIQTLKAGLEIAVDHQKKWNLAPYAQVPLNSSSRASEFKNSLGVDLIYNF